MSLVSNRLGPCNDCSGRAHQDHAVQEEGLVTKEQAVLMVEARHLDQLLHPQFKDAKAYAPDVIGSGLAASPGAAVGRVVFSAADAEAWKLRGERVVLVRHETSPEDVGGTRPIPPPPTCSNFPDLPAARHGCTCLLLISCPQCPRASLWPSDRDVCNMPQPPPGIRRNLWSRLKMHKRLMDKRLS